jgi:hypothetical protein
MLLTSPIFITAGLTLTVVSQTQKPLSTQVVIENATQMVKQLQAGHPFLRVVPKQSAPEGKGWTWDSKQMPEFNATTKQIRERLLKDPAVRFRTNELPFFGLSTHPATPRLEFSKPLSPEAILRRAQSLPQLKTLTPLKKNPDAVKQSP